MPATPRLEGHAGAPSGGAYPLPKGYQPPDVQPYVGNSDFGVPYTIRNSAGAPLMNTTVEDLMWYVFRTL